MTAAPAARETDVIKHSSKLLGFFAGAVAGALFAVFVIGTGGTGLLVAAAVGGAIGFTGGALADMLMENPGVKTGVVGPGLANILINNLDAASILVESYCYVPVVYNHGYKVIVEGSKTVLFACTPAARKGDKLLCDAAISTGSPNVLIGGAKVRVVGTRRTWVDEVLDYASAYMTVAFAGTTALGFALSAVSVGIADIQTTSLQSARANTLQTFTSVTQTNLETGLISGRIEDAVSRRAERRAMYQNYVERKRAAGGRTMSPRAYARNTFVRQGVERRMAARQPSRLASGLKLGLPIVVDFARAWREQERENAVPQHDPGLCENTSWLEPA